MNNKPKTRIEKFAWDVATDFGTSKETTDAIYNALIEVARQPEKYDIAAMKEVAGRTASSNVEEAIKWAIKERPKYHYDYSSNGGASGYNEDAWNEAVKKYAASSTIQEGQGEEKGNGNGWNGRCRCGHLHSEHLPNKSHNYSAGRCKIGECGCKHFIHDGADVSGYVQKVQMLSDYAADADQRLIQALNRIAELESQLSEGT